MTQSSYFLTNGSSLEDCHTNFFDLVSLPVACLPAHLIINTFQLCLLRLICVASSGDNTLLISTAMNLLKIQYCTPTLGVSMPTYCVFGGEYAILKIRTRESVMIAIMSATRKNSGYSGTVKNRTFPNLSSAALTVSLMFNFYKQIL